MLNYFDAVILGIIEGVTEFLPISSTAHLILTSKILGLPADNFLKTFEIAIQFGAILSVVAFYWRTLFKLEVIKRLIIALIPTSIIGALLYKIIKEYFFESTYLIIAMLFIGGIVLILFEKFFPHQNNVDNGVENLTYKQCASIGLFQSLGMVPGVSRSAATIIGGLGLGLSRKTIVEFSFLLAVPTMMAATGVDVLNNMDSLTPDRMGFFAVGFVVSFIVAWASIKFLLAYIRKHDFVPFGIYRIIVALLLLIFLV